MPNKGSCSSVGSSGNEGFKGVGGSEEVGLLGPELLAPPVSCLVLDLPLPGDPPPRDRWAALVDGGLPLRSPLPLPLPLPPPPLLLATASRRVL